MSATGCDACGSTRAVLAGSWCANTAQCWRRECANRVAESDKARRTLNVGQCPKAQRTERGNTVSLLCCVLHQGHEGTHLNGTRAWR